MLKILFSSFTILFLTSCTFGHISTIPRSINGQNVFTYEGRANFDYQLATADNMMLRHCEEYNNGFPTILQQNDKDLGLITMGNSLMNNRNQVILFTCE